MGKRWFGSFIGILVLFAACGVLPEQGGSTPSQQAIHILGNRLVDAQQRPIALRGVATSSLEYHCEGDGHFNPSDFAAMRSWNMTIVRVPLSAPFWLNEGNRCPGYRQLVQMVVQRAEDAGFVVVLSLFGIAPFPNQGNPAGAGYPMPDAQDAPAFWQSIAPVFAADPRVIFEVYSEPHEWDNHDDPYVWKIWRDGGMVHNDQANEGRIIGDYRSIGMQALVDQINRLAPDRIVLVNGMQWGGDLSYITKGFALHGKNLGYSLHLYPGPRSQDPAKWPMLFGDLAATVPVLATEFGQIDCGTTFLKEALPYLAAHTAGMIAWVWDQGTCGRPGILADWSGQPTPYGQVIRDFYLAQP